MSGAGQVLGLWAGRGRGQVLALISGRGRGRGSCSGRENFRVMGRGRGRGRSRGWGICGGRGKVQVALLGVIVCREKTQLRSGLQGHLLWPPEPYQQNTSVAAFSNGSFWPINAGLRKR